MRMPEKTRGNYTEGVYRYYLIAAHDDNTIYRVIGFDKLDNLTECATIYMHQGFIVTIAFDEQMKHSDNAVIKRAVRHEII